MNNWRQILSWKEFPELSIADKIYIRNTGRIPPHLQTQVGLDLGNWGVYQHPSLGKVAIAMDVYRYIVTIENNDSGDVESYSIDYREIINNKINPFDFEKIIDLAYKELPRKPRPLAAGMNWQNNCKNHSTNSKYDSILQVRY